MHSHREARHVHSLLYVALPVATLFRRVNLVDNNIVLHIAVGVYIECGEPHLAGVFGTGEEVENVLLFGDNTLLLLAAVCDAL